MARTILLLRLAAAACCFFCLLALLPPPVQAGRRPAGLRAADGGGLGGRRLHLLPVPEPRFVPSEAAEEEGERRRGVPVPTTTTKKKARPAAAWSVTRPELRAVPGGPDPLHHRGGSPSRRPEEQDHRTPSP